MRKFYFSIFMAISILFFSFCTCAMDYDKDSMPKNKKISFKSAAGSTDNFLEEMKTIKITLNNKGYHFPNLGEAQDAFYESCQALADNPSIQKKCVSLWGEAWGLRATWLLENTNLTVVLNDLEPKHLEDITKWSKTCGFADRLIIAPGSFLNIHQNEDVKKYFGQKPIQFHAILFANVFHHLSPRDAIKGVRYLHDHLVEGCDAFIVNGKLTVDDPSPQKDQACAQLSQKFVQLINSSQSISSIDEKKINNSYNYIVNRQTVMLYNYNKKNGISFPGTILKEEDSLCPFWNHILIQNSSGRRQLAQAPDKMKERGGAFFYIMPQELLALAKIMGFKYKVRSIILSGFGDNAKVLSHFYQFRKISVPDEAEYQKSLALVKNDHAQLKKLHANKAFATNYEKPFIGILDFETKEICYTDNGEIINLGLIKNDWPFPSGPAQVLLYNGPQGIASAKRIASGTNLKAERKKACSCPFTCSIL